MNACNSLYSMRKALIAFFAALFLFCLPSCSAKEECSHKFTWHHHQAIKSTCTSNGVKEYYECPKCGFYTFSVPDNEPYVDYISYDISFLKNDDRYIPPLGHDFDSGVIVKEPTVFEAGEKLYFCRRCSTSKSEPILPLVYENIMFNSNNYLTLSGDVAFNDTNATSKSIETCIVNNTFYFKKGHLSIVLNTSGQCSDNGLLFGINDNSDVCGLLSYYYCFISKDGFFKLEKTSNGIKELLSSVDMLYYSPSASYEIEMFYSFGHISCYVNNQLFVNFYDSSPLVGTKIGFFYSDSNVSMSVIGFDDLESKDGLMDIRDNNIFRFGSFYNPYIRNSGYFIHKKEFKKGTIVRFLGDASKYKWALCQIVNPEILYSSDWNLYKNGVPYYVDSMWNTDENFSGLDSLTTAMTFDSFLCISIAKIDGSNLTQEELFNLPNYIGALNENNENKEQNELLLYSDCLFGNIYHWDTDTEVTLRLFRRIPINTLVVFEGDTSKYKWSVIEKNNCYDKYTSTEIATKNIFDSRWNIDNNASPAFLNSRNYLVSHDSVFLDLIIASRDSTSMKSFKLESIFDYFTITNNKWDAQIDNHSAITYINHRGYSIEAPENTMCAFKLSKRNSFSYVETDISFTKDGIPVLLHDDTINRTARLEDGSEIDEIIRISEITYEDVRNYDFGIWKGEAYSGEKIPSFDEFVSFCASENIHPYIELKDTVPINTIKTCIDIVAKHGMIRKCTWISFSKERLAAVVFHDKEARLGLLTSYYKRDSLSILNSLKNSFNDTFLDQLYIDIEYTSKLCSSSGIPIETWTIDNYEIVKQLPAYISGVTTNCLNPLLVS